ncbi:MAG: DUF692 domain-containing protein [Burkholderiaceae bacterium]|jgi:uncharacterized protein (UPF0276 family)|nr:DUF692 domain-containing protein [Burkholderiaceae bacterium]
MRRHDRPPAALAGVGLKTAHVAALLERGAQAFLGGAGFVEVHAENYMVDGGPMLRHLERVRAHWPLSIHGVGLSIGGDGPLDRDHLDRLDDLLRRFQPRWFSEHLAWSSHGGHWFNDLLPLPYDRATLHRVCDHIDQVQDRLRRRLLLENPSTYLGYAGSTMDESEFLAEVVRRTGCTLLLDVNNAYVSGVNHGRDPWRMVQALIEAVPAGAVSEIHLAGFAEDHDAAGDRLLIDHHGAAVDDAVWSLYRRTIARLGPVPTLIERDNHVPTLDVLEVDAQRALDLQRAPNPRRLPSAVAA